MKSKIFHLRNVITIILILFVTQTCTKDDKSKPELPDVSVIDISQETDWNFLVLGKEDYYYIQSDGSSPELVLFHSAESNNDYYITFSDEGYVDKVVVQDYIFLFDNFNGNYLDIGIIYPDGNIELLREVETDFDWNSLTLKNANSVEAWSDVVRAAARVVSGVPCALSVAGSIASGGAGIPIAVWTCGNFLLGLTADVMTNDFDVQNGFTDFVDTYGDISTGIGCGSGDFVGCAEDAASAGLHAWANHLEDIEDKSDEINVLEAALKYGYGDVQITLTWNNIADLDLYVVDPSGEQIYWNHPYSNTGGVLDVDDINGHGPENVYWLSGEAPNGNYEVYVHHYVWDNTGYPTISNYTVLVNAFGRVKKFEGSTSIDGWIHITDFSQDDLKLATNTHKINIVKPNIKKNNQ